jgi:hypothetical protein
VQVWNQTQISEYHMLKDISTNPEEDHFFELSLDFFILRLGYVAIPNFGKFFKAFRNLLCIFHQSMKDSI